jgi:nucleotide-binding universal stress UspA family protein
MRTVLRVGPPWDELNAVAIEEGAEMIVVGTHGKTGVSRALLGSVAERTTRTATRPVLVVHAVRSKDEHGSKR